MSTFEQATFPRSSWINSPSATEADLKEAFEVHGAVASVAIILDRLTGDRPGFGFAQMRNKEEENGLHADA